MYSVEFTKLGEDRYLVNGSNNIIVSKKEMLEIEKNNSILNDFHSNKCQKEETKKRKKIEKEIKQIDEQETKNSSI